MALIRVLRQNFSFIPSITRVAFLCDISDSRSEKIDSLKENSAEYSSDGEKIHCDLKFTDKGDKTEEEIAFILESARAKAFAESVNRVVNINKTD